MISHKKIYGSLLGGGLLIILGWWLWTKFQKKEIIPPAVPPQEDLQKSLTASSGNQLPIQKISEEIKSEKQPTTSKTVQPVTPMQVTQPLPSKPKPVLRTTTHSWKRATTQVSRPDSSAPQP